MTRTTTITVTADNRKQTWHVPSGFGREYWRIAQRLGPRWQSGMESLRDLLLLVGYDAPPAVTQGWPLRKCVEASCYAANLHLRASDNQIRRHPRPKWMPEPWCGGANNQHPTVLT